MTGVIPSACSLQARGAVFRKERGKKSGTAECFKRFVSELRDKAFFIFRKGDAYELSRMREGHGRGVPLQQGAGVLVGGGFRAGFSHPAGRRSAGKSHGTAAA